MLGPITPSGKLLVNNTTVEPEWLASAESCMALVTEIDSIVKTEDGS